MGGPHAHWTLLGALCRRISASVEAKDPDKMGGSTLSAPCAYGVVRRIRVHTLRQQRAFAVARLLIEEVPPQSAGGQMQLRVKAASVTVDRSLVQ